MANNLIVNGVSLPWQDVIRPAQLRLLALIQQHKEYHGYPPTTRDLCRLAGIGSPNGVFGHLKALQGKCLISGVHSGHARALVPTCRIERIP